MSIDRWMEKENGEIYRSPNLAIWDNIDRSRGYYAKWNKSDRERQISYDFTYMWNLKNKTNDKQINSNNQRNLENKLGVTRGEENGGWLK